MKIGLDFDGVISNNGKFKSDVAKKLYDLDILPDKFKKDFVIGEGYFNYIQYQYFQKIIYGTREFGFLMEPVEGSLNFIPQLLDLGHSVSVVTSRTGMGLKIAEEWSILQGLCLDFTGVGYGLSKAMFCRGLDVFIDDDIDKLLQLKDVVPNRYLFSWGYNNHVDTEGVARRVHSWEEFFYNVNNLKKN
jgi:hypothetical protein